MSCILRAFNKFPALNIDKYNLREISINDCRDIFEIYSDYETIKYEGIKTLNNLDEAKQYIQTIINGYNNKSFIRWCIETQDSKKVVGLIALHHIDFKNSKVQIGYILNREYWKMEIMYTCLEKVINYLLNELQVNRIEAVIHPQNISSINLIRKVGFSEESLLAEYAYNPVTNKYEDRCLYVLLCNSRHFSR